MQLVIQNRSLIKQVIKIIKLYLNLALIYISGNALTKVKQFMDQNVINLFYLIFQFIRWTLFWSLNFIIIIKFNINYIYPGRNYYLSYYFFIYF